MNPEISFNVEISHLDSLLSHSTFKSKYWEGQAEYTCVLGMVPWLTAPPEWWSGLGSHYHPCLAGDVSCFCQGWEQGEELLIPV